jgi:hypothetical protein
VIISSTYLSKLIWWTTSLYLETEIYSPHLRSLLTCLETLTGEIIEVPLDEEGEQIVRLKILTEDFNPDNN